MAGSKYSISLAVRHPTRPLEDLAGELNLTPTRVWRAGAPRTAKNGKPLKGVNAESYWTARVAEGSDAEDGLAAALTNVVNMLTPKRELFMALTAGGGRVELFVGWFLHEGNADEVFGHELLGRLADVRIDLRLDAYP